MIQLKSLCLWMQFPYLWSWLKYQPDWSLALSERTGNKVRSFYPGNKTCWPQPLAQQQYRSSVFNSRSSCPIRKGLYIPSFFTVLKRMSFPPSFPITGNKCFHSLFKLAFYFVNTLQFLIHAILCGFYGLLGVFLLTNLNKWTFPVKLLKTRIPQSTFNFRHFGSTPYTMKSTYFMNHLNVFLPYFSIWEV